MIRNRVPSPPKGVVALGTEEINVTLELQLEHKVLVDPVLLRGSGHRVS